jgi:hypothetical protein
MRSAIAVILAATAVTTAAFAGDHYDKEATDVVLARAARQVQANCGLAKDDSGKSGPWGETSVTVTLGHNGHTRSVTIPDPYAGKPSGNCAVKAFSNLTFPPWTGPDETVDWPVKISQSGK